MNRMTRILIALSLTAYCAGAITINVPGDYPTIQAAFNSAASGDSIVIAPGEYEGLYCTSGPANLTLIGAGGFVNSPTIVHRSPINPYGECLHFENVSGWEIAHLTLRQVDPSGGSPFDLHYSNNIWIHHLDLAEVAPSGGNGLVLKGDSDVLVERCLIRAANYDALSCWYVSNSNITFQNNTIAGTNANGIINRAPVTNWLIRNCLVYNNDDTGFEIDYWTPSTSINYNDSYGNIGNYYGFTPGPTNLSVNPLLVGGTGWQAYLLRPNSPCIDAGDPRSPLDPDGTIADIGCFYYNQNVQQGMLTLDLEPVNPPIIIPMQGGSFNYTMTITCDSSNYALFDAWTELLLPNGYVMGPLFIRPNVFLPAGGLLSRRLNFYVSAWAMPGTYEFRGYLGDYPDSVVASDSFTFVKLANGTGPTEPGYVELSGWDRDERVELPAAGTAIADRIVMDSSPNPFNPTTVLSLKLPAAGHVKLQVVDLAGRTIATLLDRELDAGIHAVTFDGDHLASGIYLAVLNAGDQAAAERLLLLK